MRISIIENLTHRIEEADSKYLGDNMGTLLKANLLKTNDPFIMLKCYLEEVLKKDSLTWKDLIQSMITTNQPKMSTQLIDALQNLHDEGQLPNITMMRGQVKGKGDTTFTSSDDPYVYSVRQTNVRNLLNAIKSSNMEPTVVKPIVSGLETLLEDIAEDQESRPRTGRNVFPKKMPKTMDVKELQGAIAQLKELKEALQSSKLDFDGDYIHDGTFESILPKVIKNKYDIAQLRRLAGRTYAEETSSKPESELKDLREKIHAVLNETISYNHHKEGKIRGRFLDGLMYAYEAKTGVTLADIANHPTLLNRRSSIWNQVNTHGQRILSEMARADEPSIREAIAERESTRPTREDPEETFEERIQERDDVDDMMSRLREGETVDPTRRG